MTAVQFGKRFKVFNLAQEHPERTNQLGQLIGGDAAFDVYHGGNEKAVIVPMNESGDRFHMVFDGEDLTEYNRQCNRQLYPLFDAYMKAHTVDSFDVGELLEQAENKSDEMSRAAAKGMMAGAQEVDADQMDVSSNVNTTSVSLDQIL